MKDFNEIKCTSNYNLILVDTMNFCVRNYYGITLIHNGKSTSMIYGLIQFILKCAKEFSGAKVVFLLEGCHSKRKELFPDYKAKRNLLENDFFDRYSEIKEIITYMGFDQILHKGLEADDLCAYFTSISEKDDRILLVSTDRDWLSFLQPEHIFILKENTIYSYFDIEKKLGFLPEKTGMYKILRGDRSDNISGIKRIPNKLVLELLIKCNTYKEFKSFDYSENKSWKKWGDVILDNWYIIERNAELILFQKDWINKSEINIKSGKKIKKLY